MKIGIITAMPIELSYVLEQLNFTPKEFKKNTIYYADHEGCELALVSSGVGKVNASTYTQLLIDSFSPDCLFNIGIAARIKPLRYSGWQFL